MEDPISQSQTRKATQQRWRIVLLFATNAKHPGMASSGDRVGLLLLLLCQHLRTRVCGCVSVSPGNLLVNHTQYPRSTRINKPTDKQIPSLCSPRHRTSAFCSGIAECGGPFPGHEPQRSSDSLPSSCVQTIQFASCVHGHFWQSCFCDPRRPQFGDVPIVVVVVVLVVPGRLVGSS